MTFLVESFENYATTESIDRSLLSTTVIESKLGIDSKQVICSFMITKNAKIIEIIKMSR